MAPSPSTQTKTEIGDHQESGTYAPPGAWRPHLALVRPSPSEGEDQWDVVLNGPCPFALKASCPTEAAARAAMRLLTM